MKKTKIDYSAKLIAYDMNYVRNMVFVAKWLRKQANEIIKNAKHQNKNGNVSIYAKRLIIKLMK